MTFYLVLIYSVKNRTHSDIRKKENTSKEPNLR